MRKTEIIKIKGDWQEVVDDCRTTVGKDSLGKEPSKKFKREVLISEHSPIRSISVKWKWVNIPSTGLMAPFDAGIGIFEISRSTQNVEIG